MNDLRIRRGTPADAAGLAEFAARTFEETFGPANQPEHMAAHLASSYGPEQQAGELAHPRYLTLLIDADPGLAGYAQLRQHAPPACVVGSNPVELYRFYIDRPWQGRGLAQQLMQAVRAAALELGGRTLWLCVWEHNPRAIAFYVKAGFRDVGSTDFFVGPDRQTDRVLLTELTR